MTQPTTILGLTARLLRVWLAGGPRIVLVAVLGTLCVLAAGWSTLASDPAPGQDSAQPVEALRADPVAVAPSEDGWLLAWRVADGIRIRALDLSGAVRFERHVEAAVTDSPRIAVSGSGAFVVYPHGAELRLLQLIDGEIGGPHRLVRRHTVFCPGAASDGTTSVLAWRVENRLRIARFDEAGLRVDTLDRQADGACFVSATSSPFRVLFERDGRVHAAEFEPDSRVPLHRPVRLEGAAPLAYIGGAGGHLGLAAGDHGALVAQRWSLRGRPLPSRLVSDAWDRGHVSVVSADTETLIVGITAPSYGYLHGQAIALPLGGGDSHLVLAGPEVPDSVGNDTSVSVHRGRLLLVTRAGERIDVAVAAWP